MSALETAVRRLLDARNSNVQSVGYRLDLWNDVNWALEASREPSSAVPAIPPRLAPAGAEVRP